MKRSQSSGRRPDSSDAVCRGAKRSHALDQEAEIRNRYPGIYGQALADILPGAVTSIISNLPEDKERGRSISQPYQGGLGVNGKKPLGS